MLIQVANQCYNYRLFKIEFMFENYLTDLPDVLKYIVCEFRTVNHKLYTWKQVAIPEFQEMKGHVECVIVVNWGTNSTL